MEIKNQDLINEAQKLINQDLEDLDIWDLKIIKNKILSEINKIRSPYIKEINKLQIGINKKIKDSGLDVVLENIENKMPYICNHINYNEEENIDYGITNYECKDCGIIWDSDDVRRGDIIEDGDGWKVIDEKYIIEGKC